MSMSYFWFSAVPLGCTAVVGVSLAVVGWPLSLCSMVATSAGMATVIMVSLVHQCTPREQVSQRDEKTAYWLTGLGLLGLLSGAATCYCAAISMGGLCFITGFIILVVNEELAPTNELVRGTVMLTARQAASKARRLRQNDDGGVFWGGVQLPSKAADTHFCLLGAPGSGKTLLFRLLMQEQLGNIRPGSDRRALVYDAKRDVMPLLESMSLACPVKLVNPYDKRAYAWNMAADFQTREQVENLALSMVPLEEHGTGNSRFFVDSTRNLLRGVLLSFIHNRRTWNLRDLINAMGNTADMQAIILQHPRGAEILNDFSHENTFRDIRSTIRTKIDRFETVAALMYRAEQAGHTVSLNAWLTGSEILVLGKDKQDGSPLDVINQVMFQHVSKLMLDSAEVANSKPDGRWSWVFLDETVGAGRLRGLAELLREGRSKGVTVMLGIQTIEDLRRIYPNGEGEAMLGGIANKALLRLEGEGTADWARKLVGDQDLVTTSLSYGNSGQSTSERQETRPTLLASQLMQIPETNPINGLTGYFKCSQFPGFWKNRFTPKFLDESLIKPAVNVADFEPWPAHYQELPMWAPEERLQFGLEPSPSDDRAGPRREPAEVPLVSIRRQTCQE